MIFRHIDFDQLLSVTDITGEAGSHRLFHKFDHMATKKGNQAFV